MKRMILAALLLSLGSVGCLGGPQLSDLPEPKAQPVRSMPPVTDDQVTPMNAREMARRLEEECNAPPRTSTARPMNRDQ